MTAQFVQNHHIANEIPETIVALWQQAINGDSNARDILLQRLTPQTPQPAARQPIRVVPTLQLLSYSSAAPEAQEDVVALWRQSVNGSTTARSALLQRIMPASALPAMATILPFVAPPQATREAA